MKIKIKNQAFSLIEVIVALGIFAILAGGVFSVVTSSYKNFYGTGDKQSLTVFAQEGIEAVRSIRDNSWQDIENISGAGGQGIVKAAAGYWQFDGTSNTLGALTRTIVVTDVERNANDEIVASGGTIDPNTKKVTVTVSGSGIDDYVLSTYLTNWSYKTWEQSDWSGIGDREFWSDLTMVSSSYSNVSTSTLGELALSPSAGSGAILGDWASFAIAANISNTAYLGIYDFDVSPDGNTLYAVGDTAFDLRAYDIENIRDGFFDHLWTDPMDISIYTMELDSLGKYAYIGNMSYAQNGVAVEVIDLATRTVLDTETSDDPATGGNMRIMDLVINAAGSKLFAIDSHGGFHSYTINADGTLTSDIVGGGGDGNKMSTTYTLYGYSPHVIWLDESGATDYAYVTTDDPNKALAKFNISNPASISLVYAYTGSGDCDGLQFIGNSGSGNTFAISCEDTASELKILRDNGSSFDLLDTADPGSFETSPGLIYDGDNTIVVYSTTGLDLAAYYITDPANLSQVFSPDLTTFGISYSTWPHHFLEYHEKLGGFFIADYVAAGSPSLLDFIARPETRNFGASYDYKRTITLGLNSTVVSGPHSSFPVLIAESSDYLKTVTNGGHVKHDYGYDIIFTSDAAGQNILDHEIESYSSSTGEFIAWVEVSTLSSNTDIYMFYGNSNIVTSQERPTAVWGTSHKFVSHMNNRHSAVLSPADSTMYKNHLPNFGDAVRSNGKIGYDFDFDGTGDYAYGAYNEDLSITTAYTWSSWVRIDGAGSTSVNGLFGKSGNSLRFMAGNTNPAYFRFQMYDSAGLSNLDQTSYNFFTHGQWTKVDITFDKPNIILYKNGQQVTTYSWNNTLVNPSSGTFTAGTIQTNMYYLNGHMDEIKLSNVARNAGWITTSYNNENATSTFYNIGSEGVAGVYNTPGTLYSSIFDLGSTDKEIKSITVEQNIPSGCSLQITAEVSNDATFSAANVVSQVYSDTSTSYYTSSTEATLNGKRYLRYKVDMAACNSATQTPILYGAKFNYR